MALTLKFDDVNDADDALAKHLAPALGAQTPGLPGLPPEELKKRQAELASAPLPGSPAALPARKTLVMPAVPASAPAVLPRPKTLAMPPGAPEIAAAPPALGVPPTLGTSSSLAPPSPQKPKESLWKKIGHGLATAGNIAGDILAPGTMALIPGTQLHNEVAGAQRARSVNQNYENQLRAAQTEDLQSQAWERMHPEQTKPEDADWQPVTGTNLEENRKTGETKPIPGMSAPQPKTKPATDQEFMASAEQQLAKGVITDADRERLGGMQRAAKMQGISPEIAMQLPPVPVPADFPRGQNDPAYQRAAKEWGEQAARLKVMESPSSGGQPLTPQGGAQNSIVQAILEGRMKMPSAFAMKTPYWEGIMAAVTNADPQFSEQRAELRQGYTVGKQSQEINAINTALGHVGALNSAIDALQNGDVQALNRVANAYGVAIGKTPATTLELIAERVGPEIAKAYIGSGGGEQERLNIEREFSTKSSPAQLHANASTTAKLLRSKISALENQWNQNKGPGMPDFEQRFIMPQAQQVLDELAAEEKNGNAAPKVGAIENGYRFKGGDPGKQTNWEKVK